MQRVSRLSRLFRLAGRSTVMAGVSAPLISCGARSWLPAGEASLDAGEVDAPSCMGTSAPLEPKVPNLYFVLDVSGSMAQDNKWVNVRTVVANLLLELGPSARFGVTVFPPPGGTVCAPGVEVMPLRLGDSLGQTQAAFLAATAFSPQGGTPTSATFRALAPRLAGSSVLTYVILATDGGPNCDSDLAATSCSIDLCTSNTDQVRPDCTVGGPHNCCMPPYGSGLGCLDHDASVRAVSGLTAAGIKTYVMGIPGSAPYAPVLDDLARAGGTARPNEPLYYRVDSADTAALGAALNEIAAQTMKSCILTLEQTPGDPSKVNVYVDGAVIPSSGPNGWSLQGRKITIEGVTCGSIQADAGVPVVRVIEGCPTVL
jgi:hypothetical protein